MPKKVIIYSACLVIAVILFFGGKVLYDTIKYKKIISEMVIQTPDTSQIQDGTYNGSFDAILVSANVDVTVKDHEIIKIELIEHKNGRGTKAEVITNEVMLTQSLKVDTVSGATSSSKVILKAIENALTQSEQQ